MKSFAAYHGWRSLDGTAHARGVDAHGKSRVLKPRLDLCNHSPTGFEWGYAGSGPAQLALAMLADALGDDRLALKLHQRYKWHVIDSLDRDAPWTIPADDVRTVARAIAELADLEADE